MSVASIVAGLPAWPADLVERNAKIFSGDPRRPFATALAATGGVIDTVAVGDADVAGLVGPDAVVVDAMGRRTVPGLNDSHNHVIRGGLHYTLELRWDGGRSLRQALAMLCEQAAPRCDASPPSPRCSAAPCVEPHPPCTPASSGLSCWH